MRTKLQAIGFLLGLGLLAVASPDAALADNGTRVDSRFGARVVASRPTQQVRQDLKQARHRKGVAASVPELNTGMAMQGMALLLGATLLMNERRRRTT